MGARRTSSPVRAHSRIASNGWPAPQGLTLFETVWDSSFIEVIASDQISRDIAWREPGSWSVDPPAGYDDDAIETFTKLVADLNASGRAGRAGFYFRLD